MEDVQHDDHTEIHEDVEVAPDVDVPTEVQERLEDEKDEKGEETGD